MTIYNIFIKTLDGQTLTLQITSPSISGQSLVTKIFNRSPIPLPASAFRLISGTKEITPETVISSYESTNVFPSVSILPRLLGGKGGFGSLLRGAASKGGKKIVNFDACRDMSGRRLRHVNAEKKLEEWKAGEEGRKLEKLAEDFLKKKSKEVKRSSEAEVEKYLKKYKEDAERCVEEVEESVRESFRMYKKGKRKAGEGSGAESSKKLKIWMGKKKAEESESDSDSEDEKDAKSVIIDEGNNSSSSPSDRTPEVNNGSSSNGDESSGSGSLEAISEEEMDKKEEIEKKSESNVQSDVSVETVIEPALAESEKKADETKVITHEEMEGSVEPEKKEDAKAEVEVVRVDSEVQNGDKDLNEPLKFENYSSTAELEALGMERLKYELQKNGLKCGGTLQERAARLFLLKTTSVDKLPKKLLAKK